MPVNLNTFNAKTVGVLTDVSSELRITNGFQDIVDCIDSPASLKATVFTVTSQETFIITGYDLDSMTLSINRGSSALSFPEGSCICLEQIIEGSCPPAYGDSDTSITSSSILALFKNAGGLILEEQDGRICLGLPEVSDQAKEHCGLTYNKYGLVTDSTGECPIPLPEEKCCDSSSQGGSSDSDNISVALKQTSMLSGNSLSEVICSIEAAIDSVGNSVPSTSISGVKAGKGITVTGLASGCPTIAIKDLLSGGTNVTYGGFTFNTCGQLVSYTPPEAATTISSVKQGNGISVVPDDTDSSCVTISSAEASNEVLGGVYIASDSDVISGDADTSHVASIEAICQLIKSKSVDENYVTGELEDYVTNQDHVQSLTDLENKIKTTVGQDASNDQNEELPADWFTVPGSAPQSLTVPDGYYIQGISKNPTTGIFTVNYREICKSDA